MKKLKILISVDITQHELKGLNNDHEALSAQNFKVLYHTFISLRNPQILSNPTEGLFLDGL